MRVVGTRLTTAFFVVLGKCVPAPVDYVHDALGRQSKVIQDFNANGTVDSGDRVTDRVFDDFGTETGTGPFRDKEEVKKFALWFPGLGQENGEETGVGIDLAATW